jgi:hypothetical protein
MQNISQVPPEFIDPITLQIMHKPVTTPCGHSFEKKSLVQWLRCGNGCPLDRTLIQVNQLVPNLELKLRIRAYLKLHPEHVEPIIQRIQHSVRRFFSSCFRHLIHFSEQNHFIEQDNFLGCLNYINFGYPYVLY